MPGNDTVLLCARALSRLIRSIESRPDDIRPPPFSTASLLARFENALAIGDRTSAENWLKVLRGEWRLDEHNLLFAEVRLLWTFRDWKTLATAQWLPSLVYVAKLASVAKMVLEGLWRNYLEPFEQDTGQLNEIYKKHVRGFVLPLLDDLPPQADEFLNRFQSLEFRNTSSQLEHPPLGKVPDPKNWSEWLPKLSDTTYEEYLNDAREFSARQDAGQLEDPQAIQRFAASVSSVSGPLAMDRLNTALPTLMQWVKSDDGFPRKVMGPIYEVLFTLFALLDSYDKFERDSVTDLLDALLANAPIKDKYKSLIQDMGELIPEGAGRSSAYWLFDIADIVLRHPAADAGARDSFLSRIMASLQPIVRLLDSGQRAAYAQVATAAGWPPLPVPVAQETDELWKRLEGKIVALYTLTDASARQAKQALETLITNIRVEISNDHVCTTRLQNLAKNADLFVVATASAKHAATDCIMRHRGSAPLAYAAGRGFSSFMRAIAEYVENGNTK
jgi:hypothetical protein